MLEGAEVATDVLRQAGSTGQRLGRLAQLFRDGRRKVDELQCSLHLCIEGEDEAHAQARLARASLAALGAGALGGLLGLAPLRHLRRLLLPLPLPLAPPAGGPCGPRVTVQPSATPSRCCYCGETVEPAALYAGPRDRRVDGWVRPGSP